MHALGIRATVEVRQLLSCSQEDGVTPKASKQLQLRNSCTCGAVRMIDRELWRHSCRPQYTYMHLSCQILSSSPQPSSESQFSSLLIQSSYSTSQPFSLHSQPCSSTLNPVSSSLNPLSLSQPSFSSHLCWLVQWASVSPQMVTHT